jgi:hypothetical protein
MNLHSSERLVHRSKRRRQPRLGKSMQKQKASALTMNRMKAPVH